MLRVGAQPLFDLLRVRTAAPVPREELWRKARERALTRVPGRSGGLMDFRTLIPDNFIYAKDFSNDPWS